MYVGNNLNIGKVKKLAGCNPLLLSLIQGCSDIDEYARRMQNEIDAFIDNNLCVIKDGQAVSDFFASYV